MVMQLHTLTSFPLLMAPNPAFLLAISACSDKLKGDPSLLVSGIVSASQLFPNIRVKIKIETT